MVDLLGPVVGPVRRDLWEYAASMNHILNHKLGVMNRGEDCLRTKKRRRKRLRNTYKRCPENFGDIITTDHVHMNDWFGEPGVG